MSDTPQQPASDDFASQADAPAPGLLAEFWDFLKYNKKWWLLPILIVLVLLGVLAVLSSSVVAPFIYPVF
ncbi:hypothetical protein Mal4_25880 [Maioricimonas rarisocia]|uniref:Uncharacterized protein n=1 Tax=Maioricimonas rarisocia TaxID=2528026 RepID=A0A517Z758_9PLAN|nr:DUF5989 family protein [Maioricimonas rarisocia]QDU38261.1 hypothetical protein Mal4_25880 [Maioricimonas rarisocia]